MVENVTSCPVCGSGEHKLFLSCRDYTVSGEAFNIRECTQCEFKFTSPRPSQDAIGPYYQSEAYISHSDSTAGVINKLYHAVRRKTLADKVNLINQLHPKGTLLDIGCGTGNFLKACTDAGWLTKGVEADPATRQKAIQTSGCEVQADLLQAYKGKKFDVITLWHVLEHLHQLEESLLKIKGLLAKEAVLVIAVPNSGSFDARYYQQYWAAYDVPRHLYHFNPDTLSKLLAKYGLKVADTKPMKFDAFYISMLSTKYRSGKTNYVESVKNGLLSNAWAARNGNNYSSITYVISL
ncbi:MAG: SAM-dependent methyltransferases [uncultured Cytophagales bacterium]|uniref:SAM-dependent methyltransferases n=1 Tax=uncultured Cytophagales bacterium TaxID=158755 RepID=A0A6J4L151_9SPHI|nr:MAG: SAM-dependent methyltransferases [uncultured Cytophagales bacterium]